MKIEKCEPGYITRQKKMNSLWLGVFILIGAVIFLIGYLWTHTRANIFTVLAVLMVLPAAKRIVALVVMLPRRGVKKERYDRLKEAAGEAVLLTDYVFTSTEKIMNLDFVVVKNGNVLGVIADCKQDVSYMKEYLTENIHKIAPSFYVRVFDTDEQLIKQLDRLTQIETTPEKEEKVVSYLRSLAV
ncbi:MAG: hypothetical protein J1F22_05755 [Lachnospiraceae bacterium]|nr:hypothetical protein [Lachnospiraceae bacterium]